MELHTVATLCSFALKITSGWCCYLHLTNEELEPRGVAHTLVEFIELLRGGATDRPFPKLELVSLTGVIRPYAPKASASGSLLGSHPGAPGIWAGHQIASFPPGTHQILNR